MIAPRPCATCGSAPRIPGRRTCGTLSCQHDVRMRLLEGRPICIVCSRAIPRDDTLGRRICSEAACRDALLRLPKDAPACFVCRAPEDPRPSSAGTCGFIECVSLAPVRRGIDLRKQQAGELLEAVRELQARQPEPHPLAVFPATPGRTAPVSRRRAQEFRTHVEKLLKEAQEGVGGSTEDRDPPGATPSTPRNDALMGRLCGMCRGFCCGRGDTHAFLTAADLRLYLERHPEERPEDLVGKYVNRIPARSIRGSCVFHTSRGCNLPRDLMSHTCTKFYCEGLARVRREYVDRDLEAVLAVSHRDGRIVKHAVVGPP